MLLVLFGKGELRGHGRTIRTGTVESRWHRRRQFLLLSIRLCLFVLAPLCRIHVLTVARRCELLQRLLLLALIDGVVFAVLLRSQVVHAFLVEDAVDRRLLRGSQLPRARVIQRLEQVVVRTWQTTAFALDVILHGLQRPVIRSPSDTILRRARD